MLPRSTPTIFNVRFQHSQFWDGRADSPETLALMPVENALEMGSSRAQAVRDVVSRVRPAGFVPHTTPTWTSMPCGGRWPAFCAA